MASNLLITGSAKGLGQYLHTKLGGVGLTRENSSEILQKPSSFSTIIHCAFSDPLQAAQSDNISLTQSLLKLKSDNFIFISSADVYPDNNMLHTEDEIINESGLRSEYAVQKIECEKLVLKTNPSALIIRPVTIFSENPRSRNLQRLLNESQPKLSLSDKSTLNFVTSEEIFMFIEISQKNKLSGIYNLARNKSVQLDELAFAVGKNATFGSFTYRVGNLSNKKASAYLPSLNESSLDFFKRFLSQKNI
jgi:nucleoside-diphosphate-sugar epimerase